MGIDVTAFHQTFFEESREGLENMEDGLLELEDGTGNDEAINTIFRAAHSIKGGAGTLGFTAISEFTHHVETILDRRRSGGGPVSHETVDVLLASVDCLRDMIASVQHGADVDVERVTAIEARLRELVDRDATESAAPEREPAEAAPAVSSASGSGSGPEPGPGPAARRRWRVDFAPHDDLFRSGNDPVRILGELADLGPVKVHADLDALPRLADLDVEVCYAAWRIELRSSDDEAPIARADIEQVFDWVTEEADIEIVELAGAETPPGRNDTDGSGTAADTEAADADAGDPASAEINARDARSSDADADSSKPHTTAGPGPAPAAAERRDGSDRRHAPSSSIRVDIEKVDSLINMVGELVITQSMLQQLASQGEHIDVDKLREGLAELEGNTRELQGSVMQIRMLPISVAFSRLPRLVRDLASQLDKQVELEIHGETTELDKTVMEKIGDPLVHLVRNSLDHGIESPDERRACGKPEVGTVAISAYHEGGTIVVEIADDGAGLQSERILAKARDRGLVGDDEQLTEKQIHDLIFHPGFSTAETVSDISGRGVGMDVVRRNITDLGGLVEAESTPGAGTTFRIRLPLTLAILDGQVVRVGDQVFIIPLISIVESLQFDRSLTGDLARHASVYRHRDAVIPLIDLNETFAVGAQRDPESDPLLVVVDSDGTRAGLLVDDLLAQQQVVIKSLTTNFRPVLGLSGATILGDGTVAMILDVNSVLAVFQHSVPAPTRVTAAI